jgi:N-methylhydantoinase B/oxoprolinase/acetone carboxylase alpha subunit
VTVTEPLGERGADRRSRALSQRGDELPAKVTLQLSAGDVVTVETPGGGGFGKERE